MRVLPPRRPSTRTRVAQALLFGALLWARGAAAKGEPDADKQLLHAVEEARDKASGEDFAGALAVLEQAYARIPSPALLWPMAELHLRLSHPVEGLETLDRYVAAVPANLMPQGQQLPDVERMRGELNKLSARLSVSAAEDGTLVVVDGKPVCKTPLAEPIVLNPGKHRVEGQVSRSMTKDVSLSPGQSMQLNLPMTPTGQVTIAAAPRSRTIVAPIVLGTTGVFGIIAGAVLLGLNGRSSCTDVPACMDVVDTRTAGAGALGAGIGMTVVSAVWLGIELSHRTPRQR